MADLNVHLKGLDLKNPVLTASGTFGYGSAECRRFAKQRGGLFYYSYLPGN